MKLICPDNPDISIPLRIAAQNAQTGARIGGTAPQNVVIPPAFPTTRYFATIPITEDPELEMSIFLTRSFDEMTHVMGQLWSNGDPVFVIVHPPRRRSDSDSLASSYSGQAIRLGEPERDINTKDNEFVPSSDHKIGGRPYFISGDRGLEPAVRGCLDKGFFHAVQFDFPGAEDAGDGDWPFGDGVFHVLARSPFGKEDFKCFWEF